MANLPLRLRHLTRRDAALLSVVGAAIGGMALTMLVGMGFQPGWANGWPMGISKHVVFASFVTIIFVIVSVSLASALLIWLGVFVEQIAKRPFVGWMTFFAVLLVVTVGVLLASPHVYAVIHAGIVREWR
jgi:hypothetical protein